MQSFVFIGRTDSGAHGQEINFCSMLSEYGFNITREPLDDLSDGIYAEKLNEQIASCSAAVVFTPASEHDFEILSFCAERAISLGKDTVIIAEPDSDFAKEYEDIPNVTVIVPTRQTPQGIIHELFVCCLCKHPDCLSEIHSNSSREGYGELISTAISAHGGDAEAQMTLAEEYFLGEKLPKMPEEAVFWLKTSSDKGNIHALIRLGKCLLDGIGCEKHPSRALTLFMSAANENDIEGIFLCGKCFFEGAGTEKDLEMAIEYLSKAIEADPSYHEAEYILALCYSELGEKKKARDCFLSAAENGNKAAYVELGDLYCDEDFELHNPSHAFEAYKNAADCGEPRGFYNAGACFYSGYGCIRNAEEARDYFKKGALLGDADCMLSYAMCCEFGEGGEADQNKAFVWYSKAAELSSAEAVNNLGGCYLYGHGIEKDEKKAFELFLRAAELGSSNALCRVGRCLENGIGCEKDPDAAIEYYLRAADAENTVACKALSILYERGGGKEAATDSFKILRRAATLGDGEAMHSVGLCLMRGHGTARDPWAAFKYFSAAEDSGYSPAYFEVANCYFEGVGTPRNWKEAFLRYRDICTETPKNYIAQYRLGLCYLGGLGTERSPSLAFECFEKSSKYNFASGIYMTAECYMFGVGVKKSIDSAVKYYRAAANLGHSLSCNILGSIYERGDGVEKDIALAISLYKKSASKRNTDGYYNFARLISRDGSQEDLALANSCFLRAAKNRSIPAMLALGKICEDGTGVPRSLREAETWYYRALSASVDECVPEFSFEMRKKKATKKYQSAKIEAEYRLGKIKSLIAMQDSDFDLSFEYIASAASMGFPTAQADIARMFKAGVLDGGKTYAEYCEQAEKNQRIIPQMSDVANAMNKLGDLYFDGDQARRISKNEALAVRCYKMAAEEGQNNARYSLGWCLRHGVGIRENHVEAAKWLKLSADNGNPHAAYSYGLCCEEGIGKEIKNKREAIAYYRRAAVAGHEAAAKRYALLSDSRRESNT